MLLELLVDFVLWLLVLIGSVSPISIQVPSDILAASDSLLSFISQGSGVLKFIYGDVIVFVVGMGLALFSFRMMLNVVYFVFRWIPFIGVGGD